MAEVAEQKHQVVGQFSQQAEGYAKLTTGLATTDRHAAFRALVQPQPDDRLLEVCCGPGAITLDLAPRIAHATGLDLTPAMLEQGRAAQAAQGIANIDWIEGDICDLPFADESFSIVASSAAFHHLTDPRAAFREMARVCRPGGRIVIRDVTPAADKSAAYDRMEKLRDPSHTHALSPEEMRGLGEGAPVGEPQVTTSITADLSLDAILATSFPEACTLDDLRAMFREDALSGEDELGFGTRLVDDEVRVSYTMTTALWMRT
jgi:ubiquinone/menaquinone biosynthesis C-methylase UbiE